MTTPVMTTAVMTTSARNPREESRRTTPGQQRLLRQFLLDPQPLQLSFLMSLPLQPGNYFKPFYPPPPYIPGCYQPGPLPRNPHKIRKEEESWEPSELNSILAGQRETFPLQGSRSRRSLNQTYRDTGRTSRDSRKYKGKRTKILAGLPVLPCLPCPRLGRSRSL